MGISEAEEAHAKGRLLLASHLDGPSLKAEPENQPVASSPPSAVAQPEPPAHQAGVAVAFEPDPSSQPVAPLIVPFSDTEPPEGSAQQHSQSSPHTDDINDDDEADDTLPQGAGVVQCAAANYGKCLVTNATGLPPHKCGSCHLPVTPLLAFDTLDD